VIKRCFVGDDDSDAVVFDWLRIRLLVHQHVIFDIKCCSLLAVSAVVTICGRETSLRMRDASSEATIRTLPSLTLDYASDSLSLILHLSFVMLLPFFLTYSPMSLLHVSVVIESTVLASRIRNLQICVGNEPLQMRDASLEVATRTLPSLIGVKKGYCTCEALRGKRRFGRCHF
jgi:hypothetical protein